MGVMTIDGRKVEFTDEPNILTVIRKADIDIPTLCYHSELSVYGACRLCTVENDKGKTFASCSEPPRDGMVIYKMCIRDSSAGDLQRMSDDFKNAVENTARDKGGSLKISAEERKIDVYKRQRKQFLMEKKEHFLADTANFAD